MNLYRISQDKIYKKIVVHRFNLPNLYDEDIELVAASSLSQWKNSKMGEFIFSKSVTTPAYTYQMNISNFSYDFVITAELEPKHITEFYLRWNTADAEQV